MTSEELKQKRQEKRTKKALRSYRFRPLKNFLWWFTGIICGVIFFVGGLVAGVLLIPVNTFTGGNNEGIVSDELADSTLLEIVININDYGFSDLPVLLNALESITEGEAGKYIDFDFDKLAELKFGENFAEEFKSCITVVATIENTIGVDALGDFGKLNIFNEWEEVSEPIDTGAETFNAKLYYYSNNQTFVRAFDDNGNRLAPSGEKIYYAALAKVPMLEAFDLINERVGNILISELFETLGGATLTEDSLINGIIEGKTINQIGDITTDDVYLVDILPSGKDNHVLVGILEDEFGKPYDEIVLTDLKHFDIGLLHLYKVIPEEEIDENFKAIICDITKKSVYEEIFVTDLYSKDGVNVLDNIMLSSVIGSANGNSIIEKAIDKNASLGNLGSIIDGMSLLELYGENVFKPISGGSVPSGALRFNKSGDEYTMVQSGGTHYLNSNAGLWLFLCFNAEDVDVTTGRPAKYVGNDATLKQLQENGNLLADSLADATVRQLVDAGVVQNANTLIMSWTLEQVLNYSNFGK